MHRHHVLALHKLDPPADSISLLIGAEADRGWRGSSQIPLNPSDQAHKRLPQLLSGSVPRTGSTSADENKAEDDSRDETGENEEETGPGFLERVNSHNRFMQAHTKHQIASPASRTLPSYTKTMHAFTLNQLNYSRRSSRSETSSPHIGVKGAVVLPSKVRGELTKLNLGELPHGPVNTPEQTPRESDVQGIDFRKLKKRSVTEPVVTRDFAAVKCRDFAESFVVE